jgi:hypothetical protein
MADRSKARSAEARGATGGPESQDLKAKAKAHRGKKQGAAAGGEHRAAPPAALETREAASGSCSLSPSLDVFGLFSLPWKSPVSFCLNRKSFVFPIGLQAITTEMWRRP